MLVMILESGAQFFIGNQKSHIEFKLAAKDDFKNFQRN